MKAALIATILLLAACGGPRRDTPELQVADNKLCLDAGMQPYMTEMREIICKPKEMAP